MQQFDLVTNLEAGVTRDLMRRRRVLHLPTVQPGSPVEPVFAATIWWLKTEADISEIVSALPRGADPMSDDQAERFGRTYFAVCGYPADAAGPISQPPTSTPSGSSSEPSIRWSASAA